MAVRLILVRSVFEKKNTKTNTFNFQPKSWWWMENECSSFISGWFVISPYFVFLGRSLYPIWKDKNFNQQFSGTSFGLFHPTFWTYPTYLARDFRNSIGSNFWGVNHTDLGEIDSQLTAGKKKWLQS